MMRRAVLLSALILAIVFGVLGLGRERLARAGATSTIIPLDAIRSQDCTGETVALSGSLHLVSHLQANGSVIGHFNYQGVSGTGETSGITYRVSSVDHVRIGLVPPFPADVMSVGTIHLVAPGTDNNLVVRVLFHLTVNALGEVTAAIDRVSSECR